MPRVISGEARGRILRAPQGRRTRPTADRVKEALFSVLESRVTIAGSEVLELFAGSGQLGIEALSRGAISCAFVERQRRVCALIDENLRACRLSDRAEVRRGDALRVCHALRAEGRQFDLILIDPPYQEAAAFAAAFAPLLASPSLLRVDAYLVLEFASASEQNVSEATRADAAANSPKAFSGLARLQKMKCCQYGTTMLSFYQYC